MRRYGWLIVGLMLLALWAWSQRASVPIAQTPAARTTLPEQATHEAKSPASVPSISAPSIRAPADDGAGYPAFLPHEAIDILQRIARGGPFKHRQDGAVFQNRERRLPAQPRGYYREYTVQTPGSRDRGARRIVAGGAAGGALPAEYFYTDDHYRSFRRFTLAEPGPAP